MTTSPRTAPAETSTAEQKQLAGLYSVSIQHGDRDAMRAAAYAEAGLSVNGVDQDKVVLADSYTQTGYTTADLIALIDGIHTLAVDPASMGRVKFDPFDDGSDGEERQTTMFMFGLGGRTGEQNWLACVEAAHAAWPRLMVVLGASVSAQVFPSGDADAWRSVCVPELRVPKVLRLKGGWDYDSEGNQVWLPFEEAWRRFVALNDTHSRDSVSYMNPRLMRRMRRHMKANYNGKATTRP